MPAFDHLTDTAVGLSKVQAMVSLAPSKVLVAFTNAEPGFEVCIVADDADVNTAQEASTAIKLYPVVGLPFDTIEAIRSCREPGDAEEQKMAAAVLSEGVIWKVLIGAAPTPDDAGSLVFTATATTLVEVGSEIKKG